jgi:hypothetical protein
MKDDLWGVLPAPSTSPLPANVLKEQGAILAEKTNGILIGQTKVSFDFYEEEEFTCLEFYIVCPTLNNYRYEVLSVQHPRFGDAFPARIFFQESAKDDVKIRVTPNDLEEFKNCVKDVLQSERVKTVISALLRDAQQFDQTVLILG